jgi:hypothetical protein
LVALALIGVGLGILIASQAARLKGYLSLYYDQLVGIGLGLSPFWGGWILLFVWLIRGYIRRVTLRHTLRVGPWIGCAYCLTAALFHVDGHLENLRAVSLQLLALFLAIGSAFAGAGWYEWQLSSSHHTENHAFDDWSDGEGGYADSSRGGDSDADSGDSNGDMDG